MVLLGKTVGLSSLEFTHVEIQPLLCEESQEQVVSLNREKKVEHFMLYRTMGTKGRLQQSEYPSGNRVGIFFMQTKLR